MRGRMASDQDLDLDSAVAVVGLACRFPGAPDPDAFWRNLRDGVESIRTFSRDECVAAGVPPELVDDPAFVRAGAPVEHAEDFDAGVFGMTPREADFMDPQHRVLLECAWEALERAGCDPDRFDGPIGLFAGTTTSTYLMNQLVPSRSWQDGAFRDQAIYENFPGFLATRISYKLDLRGPSVMVQSACSTALVAVHLAVRSLLDFESDLALAGGVTVQVPQTRGYLYEPDGILSPDGHCRPFDANAQGTVFGNGAGIVALKRLEDALRDGDTIHAVVLGTAVNNDGAAKAGFTAPSPNGQAEVVATAQAVAGVDPRWITFIETHGTGTALGDPIEVAALSRVFRAKTADTGFCALGAVKGNVGHLDAAAGIAGFIKAVLAIRHAVIPPTLHVASPNPKLELAASPFFVNTDCRTWSDGAHGRIAGVSAFGFGGTNAHAVLAQAPAPAAPGARDAGGPQVLVLSAASQAALDAVAERLAQHLEGDGVADLADTAFTLQTGRRVLPFRRHVVATDVADAVVKLKERATVRAMPVRSRNACFLFPGQGSQFAGMGAVLYGREPVFRDAVDACARMLQPFLGEDIRDVMFATGDDAGARLAQTRYTQPALFVASHAMARLWMSWGVDPRALIGHSVGEYVAACVAGVMSLEDALAVVAERGRLMQSMEPGEMLAVLAPAGDVSPRLPPGVEIAAINSPDVTVCAGPSSAIAVARTAFADAEIECRPVRTSHAFHSAMMAPALAPFRARLATVTLSAPRIPFVSNVTGAWITDAQATDPDYWCAHLRGTVRFSDGVETLLADATAVLLECGPGNALTSLVRRRVADSGPVAIATMAGVRDGADETHALLGAVGDYWAAGGRLDWKALHGTPRRRVELPTYPFQRRRHWLEPGTGGRRVTDLREPRHWCHVRTWEGRPFAAPPGALPDGPWLVMSSPDPVDVAVAEALASIAPAAVTRVVTGVDGRSTADDVERAWTQCAEAGATPKTVFRIGLGPLPADATDTAGLHRELDAGLLGWLALARAAGPAADPGAPVRIVEATCGASALTSDEPVSAGRAAGLSAVRGIGLEYEGLRCTSVDFGPAARGRDAREIARLLCREAALPSPVPVVAIRGATRWEPVVQRLSMAEDRPDPSRLPLRRGGSYLVTGGFGGIGLTLARYLAAEWGAKLTLVGRRPPADGEVAGELERLGAEVLVAAADVSDPDALRAAVAATDQRFGRLDGVIHAAGIAMSGVIDGATHERLDDVMRPKADAMLVFAQVLGERPLDWVFVCSSLVTAVPVAGQVEYTAANAVLDALPAALQTRVRWPIRVAAWDRWLDAGMAARAQADASRGTPTPRMGAGISGPAGIETFCRILASDESLVYVATFDLVAQQAANDDGLPVSGERDVAEAIAGTDAGTPRTTDTPFRAPESELQQRLAAIWEGLLGVAPVGVDDNFFELGGDSLVALRVAARVRRDLQCEMKPNLLFEAPTIAALEARLKPPAPNEADTAASLRARIDAMSPEEVRAMLAQKRGKPAG
ncbi:MAG: SDR family NAD(P)-dependent oxidoreductase [Betaproteobacteria bacterium]|nr:SDR family NAD(P)-dependent oxidoreductase [Betaproteobacteria bacterium]